MASEVGRYCSVAAIPVILTIVLYTVAATALRGTPSGYRMLTAAHVFTGLWLSLLLPACITACKR